MPLQVMPLQADPGASWPPAPEGQPPPIIFSGEAEEALHQGWRLLVLGCFVPVIFLPLAAWQGVAAGKARPGAGTSLLLAIAGVSALWAGAVLLFIHFG